MSISTFFEQMGNVLILLFLVGIPLYGFYKKVPVYDTFIEGAKEGFPTFLRIMPYILAMLVAIGMLRASGAFDFVNHLLGPTLQKIGIPAEIIPIAIIRPFSAGAATALCADLLHTHGGNAMISHLAVMVSSSADTTFYIAALYFGAVAIRNTRHAIPVSILVDVVGMFAAILFGNWLLK